MRSDEPQIFAKAKTDLEQGIDGAQMALDTLRNYHGAFVTRVQEAQDLRLFEFSWSSKLMFRIIWPNFPLQRTRRRQVIRRLQVTEASKEQDVKCKEQVSALRFIVDGVSEWLARLNVSVATGVADHYFVRDAYFLLIATDVGGLLCLLGIQSNRGWLRTEIRCCSHTNGFRTMWWSTRTVSMCHQNG